MTRALLIDNKNPLIQFSRSDGYSLATGYAVAYGLKGYRFKVIATRHGVDVAGSYPLVGKQGIYALIGVLLRATRQHEHLASFPEGTQQTPMSEEMLEAELSQPRASATTAPDPKPTVS